MRPLLSRWMVSLTVVLAASAAQATISVDEIVRLHTAGLSPQSLLLVVSASDTPDTLSTAQLTQMINAQVPDTVISELVSKADAVMEDWQPVNIEQEMQGRQVYTETEVYNVYPGWDGYYGGFGYGGWCGTPYYGGWYDPWYSGLYVGFGWGGGWGFGFGWGGGYGGYYDPWYYGGGYYGGGYCGYYDPYYGYGYDDYYGYNTYREIDRPNYSNGADRGTQRGASPTPYRQDPSSGTSTGRNLATLDSRTMSTLDRSAKTPNQKALRGNTDNAPATRSVENLKQVSTPTTQKSTLTTADRGQGRYAIKGDDRKVRDDGTASGKTLETLGKKFERSSQLEPGASTKTDRSVKSEVTRGLERSATGRNTSTEKRVADATRSVTHKASSTAGVETTGQKVNRYVQMKSAQQASGTSRGNRTSAKSAGTVGNSTKSYASSGKRGESSTAGSGTAVGKQGSPGTKSSTGRSTPRASGSSSGQRATVSAGAPSRSGGGSFSGGSRSGGGGGSRSAGGGGSRGGGGGSRGGGGGGSRGGGR